MKFIVLLLALILIPSVNAWKYETHQNIVEYVYWNLPYEKQQELNLTALKEGAVIPDRDFKDYRLHHYPKSLEEAEKWLNNETDISLNLGIASHYITDSFAAPHNIAGEDYYQHSYFEGQVKYYYPNVDCADYGFFLNDLNKAAKNSKDWDVWLKTKNKEIPEKEVDEAAKFLFSIVLKKLNTTCNTQPIIKTTPYITKKKIILSWIVLIIGLYLLKR